LSVVIPYGHTSATILANAGVPPKQLQAFLGHDDIEMTLGIYTHIADNAAFDTSNKMGEVISAIGVLKKSCSENCSDFVRLKIKTV